MDITVTTSDPDLVDAEAIAELIEVGGYFVASVTVEDRDGVRPDQVWEFDNAGE